MIIIIGNPESSGWIHAHFTQGAAESLVCIGEAVQNLSKITEEAIIPIVEFNTVTTLVEKEVCNPMERFNKIRKFK
jgi:hypothetical protein